MKIFTYGGKVGKFDGSRIPDVIYIDPLDSYTKLLCHFDTNGKDSSSYNRTPTNYGSATSSTCKFGGGSLRCGGSLTASYTYTQSTDFTIGTDDFTIEAWVNIDDVSNTNILTIYSSWYSNNQYQLFGIRSNTLWFSQSSSGDIVNIIDVEGGSNIIVSGVWNHVAISRISGVLQMF